MLEANEGAEKIKISPNKEIIPRKEAVFFSYASRWYVDLNEEEIEPDWKDISGFEIPEDYPGTYNPAKFNIYIMSLAGKPLYYRFGEDDEIIPLLGVAYTLFMSINELNRESQYNYETIIDDNSYLKSNVLFMRGEKQIILFYCKPPLIFISVADISQSFIKINPNIYNEGKCKDMNFQTLFLHDFESTKVSSHQQISLMNRVRDFILSVVTQSILLRTYNKYKNFNFNRLLAGSEKMLEFWLQKLDVDLCLSLNCIKYLNILPSYRNSITKVILQFINTKDILFTLLLYKSYVISSIQQDPYTLTPNDIHLLINMLNSSSTFKASEITCTPICLPNFNSNKFLCAHISYLDPNKRYCLVFLTPDQNASFSALSQARNSVAKALEEKGHLSTLNDWIIGSAKHVYTLKDVIHPTIGSPTLNQLIHFAYLARPGHYVTAPIFPRKWGDGGQLEHSNDVDRNIIDPNIDGVNARDVRLREIYCAYVDLKYRTDNSSVLEDPINRFSESLDLHSFRHFSTLLSPSTGDDVVPYYRLSTPRGVTVVWRDLRFELFAYFQPYTNEEQIRECKEAILKWIHREYKSLFPTTSFN